LFVIGSMKSATTYLSGMLAAHPSIFVSEPKEPCFFVDPTILRKVWPHMWRLGYWRSEQRYLSLFAAAGDAQVIAEASTTYSQAPLFAGVPQRIAEFSRNARFVYILRDPVERTISHYWHTVNWWGERRSMLDAIRSNPHYADVSHYALQLRAYLRCVPRERIYVLTYEALRADPQREIATIYHWLGVNPAVQPPGATMPINATPAVVEQVRGLGILQRFRSSRLNASLSPLLPKAVRDFGARMAVRNVRPGEYPTGDVKAALRPRQCVETEELSRLLNRRFPEWTTLYGES
jgi:hypothetical protein